ncbi:MAG: hypothetical protein IJ087_01370 [Eggerthellaceae bacterium]|nr:hypothetical protein [Eggerthellaceae bacterium]
MEHDYTELYRIASYILDEEAFESEGITREYHAWVNGVTEYQFDMVIGRMVDEARKAMRKVANDYKDGLLSMMEVTA